MPIIRKKEDLENYIAPSEIGLDINNALETIEKYLDSNVSYIAIIETQEELDSITKQVHNVSPEVDEHVNNSSWRKRVYILDDYGNGIVLYNKEE